VKAKQPSQVNDAELIIELNGEVIICDLTEMQLAAEEAAESVGVSLSDPDGWKSARPILKALAKVYSEVMEVEVSMHAANQIWPQVSSAWLELSKKNEPSQSQQQSTDSTLQQVPTKQPT